MHKVFHRKFVGYRNEITQIHMHKPVSLGLSIFHLSRTVMYDEFWYDYVKVKYGEKSTFLLYGYS